MSKPNTKERIEQMAAYALRNVRIEPYSAEAQALIDEAMAEHGFANQAQAVQFLKATGKINGTELGGKVSNQRELERKMMNRFGCTKGTAQRHIKAAAKLRLNPKAEIGLDRWGGPRPGSGRPVGSKDSYTRGSSAATEG